MVCENGKEKIGGFWCMVTSFNYKPSFNVRGRMSIDLDKLGELPIHKVRKIFKLMVVSLTDKDLDRVQGYLIGVLRNKSIVEEFMEIRNKRK